jgi:hypothetical protein
MNKEVSDRVRSAWQGPGALDRRVVLPASPSRVECCIFRLLSAVDVSVRVHQLLRSSLSLSVPRIWRKQAGRIENDTPRFDVSVYIMYQQGGCTIAADQLSYL